MKKFISLGKKLKTKTGQEHSGPSARSDAFTTGDKNARKVEEEYGIFILHDLPHDQANALEYVL